MKQYAIIVAGGKGLRMGSEIPKQFIEINKKAVLLYTLEKFSQALPQAELVLVLPVYEMERWKRIAKGTVYENITIAPGGKSRFESVRSGLSFITEAGVVGIHDAVRPLVSVESIQRVYAVAQESGAAIPVVELKDSLRHLSAASSAAVDRSAYRLVQTPQCFHTELLSEAYLQEENHLFTDDASVVEQLGHSIQLVEGNRENIKLTTVEDLAFLEFQLSR